MSFLFAARTSSLCCSSTCRMAFSATFRSETSTSCDASKARRAAWAIPSAALLEDDCGSDMLALRRGDCVILNVPSRLFVDVE
jgi:hypothetical protein